VELELANRNQSLLLSMVGVDPEQELERYRHLARSERVDGVIVTDLRFDDPRIALLEELHLHAVTLNRPDIPSPFPAVCQDDGPGVAAAVDHLADLGHTRSAYVAGRPDMLHGAHRAAVWAETMRRRDLADDLVEIADFTAASGARATRALLERTPPPTAIVYANDTMAIAGLTVAHELGLKPPRDLSLVGYEDSELAAHVYPALTSGRSDPLTWGRTATRVLLDAIDGRAADVELEPARLVLRASTQERRPT
jgi:DNA-binding LacI/PurR family transcriptional regulator